MKICMIGSLPPPFGGVSTHCYYLTERLAKDGIQVHFLDTNEGKGKQIPSKVNYYQLKRNNILIHPLYALRRPKYFKFFIQLVQILGISRVKNIEYALSIIQFLSWLHKKENLELVHTHHAGIRSLGALLFCKYYKVPFIMTVHGAEITLEENWHREERMITYLLRETDFIISVSQFTASYLLKRGFSGNIYIIPNGIDFKKFQTPELDLKNLREKYCLPERVKIILYVSAFKDWKGPDIFIRALKKVKYPFFAVMIGRDLGYLQYCQNLANELQLFNKIRFLIDLPENEIIGFYHLANIFVFPTRVPSEGFGIVALEAMATGTPVIASKIAAIPEIIKNNKTGLLVEPGNSDELASRINLLLSNKELCEQLSKNGLKFIQASYTWSKISRKIINLYQKVITT